jgi:hypothetical protein
MIAEPEPYATDVRESDDEREHSVHIGVHTGLRQRPHRSTRGHLLLDPPPPAAPRHLWTAVLGVRRRSAVERFRQSAASQRRPDPSDPVDPVVSANRTSTRPGPGALALARARPRPGPAASALARARPALVARVAAADVAEELDERVNRSPAETGIAHGSSRSDTTPLAEHVMRDVSVRR